MNRTRILSFLCTALIAVLCVHESLGQLALQVDRSTGGVQLVNDPNFSVGPVSFDAYLIRSDAGALSPFGWSSLQSQVGDDWFVTGAPSENLLAEAKLVGATTLALGQSLSLGNAYMPFPGFQDLEFEFAPVGGPPMIVPGPVVYVGDPFPPVGLVGDYNFDGIVSHADYSVLGDAFGSTDLAADGDGDGTVGIADYHLYAFNFGNIALFSAASGLPPSIVLAVSVSVTASATLDGNTSWAVSFSGVQSSLAGHLNITTSGAAVLSATAGSSFQDDGAAPVGVPGFPAVGGIADGIIINGSTVYASLGTTLGAPSPGPNQQFLTFVTEGTQTTTLSIEGEYGYQSANYSLSSNVVFGPGATAADPLLPSDTNPGEFIFTDVPSGVWFDPPLVDSFEYVMDSASLFTAILDFPPGFAEEFMVTAENTLLGEFGPGDSVDFVALLGHGVENFIVSNITPLADAANPDAFPLKLAFSTPTASFRMLAVPEPGTLFLIAFPLATLLIGRRRKSTTDCTDGTDRIGERV